MGVSRARVLPEGIADIYGIKQRGIYVYGIQMRILSSMLQDMYTRNLYYSENVNKFRVV